MERTDILIAGGGTAGLAAAAAFGSLGLRVTCVDPAPAEAPDGPDADLRTTAILQPGRGLLDQAGLWERLAPRRRPFGSCGSSTPRGRPVERAFDAGDLGDQPFGWNIPNLVLKRAFAERLAGMPDVTLLRGTGFAGRRAEVEDVVVTLSDRRQVAARLLVGARRAGLDGARGLRDRGADHALRAEGAGLRGHAREAARRRIDRDPRLGRPLHAGAAARPRRPALLGSRLDDGRNQGAVAQGSARRRRSPRPSTPGRPGSWGG